MNKKVQITNEGLEALKEELNGLLDDKRPLLVERLAHARTQGDLAENSDYQNARDELEFMDGRIEELKHVINTAVIIKGNGRKSSVDVGTKVKVKFNGKENTFYIVGEWEANPAEQKISHTSPLGQALFGKKVGEKVEFEAPAGIVRYEILEIG